MVNQDEWIDRIYNAWIKSAVVAIIDIVVAVGAYQDYSIGFKLRRILYVVQAVVYTYSWILFCSTYQAGFYGWFGMSGIIRRARELRSRAVEITNNLVGASYVFFITYLCEYFYDAVNTTNSYKFLRG